MARVYDMRIEQTSYDIDYGNGYSAYYGGADLDYYTYSAGSYNGWRDAEKEHQAHVAECVRWANRCNEETRK
jgi:hypothetical protein